MVFPCNAMDYPHCLTSKCHGLPPLSFLEMLVATSRSYKQVSWVIYWYMKSDPLAIRSEAYSEVEEFRDATCSEKIFVRDTSFLLLSIRVCIVYYLFLVLVYLLVVVLLYNTWDKIIRCGFDNLLIFSCLLVHALYWICLICLTLCLFKKM